MASQKETPECLDAEEVIRVGMRAAARFGILCRPPNLPLMENSFIPKNGDAIFSCFSHANNPSLRGADLQQEAWELRTLAVGTAMERLEQLSDSQWTLLQAILNSNDEEALSREEIRLEMERYMDSGEHSGSLGNILPQLAASYLQQPLLVIEIVNSQVININWIDPGRMFGEENQEAACPVIAILQLKHYEVVLVANEAKETALAKYQGWKASERVVPASDGGSDESFNPPCASTPIEMSSRHQYSHSAGMQHNGGSQPGLVK